MKKHKKRWIVILCIVAVLAVAFVYGYTNYDVMVTEEDSTPGYTESSEETGEESSEEESGAVTGEFSSTADTKNATVAKGYFLNDVFHLTLKNKPENAEVTFSSDDPNIVKISQKGFIRGKSLGTTTIHVSVTNEGEELVSYDKSVTVIADMADLYPSLEGKSIIGIGDSLMYGHWLGNQYSWINRLGKIYNMDVHNYGINGNPIAKVEGRKSASMCERYKDIVEEVEDPDIVVLEGGANDKRLNVPIGNVDDTTPYTFEGALNITITGLQEAYPDAKIVCLTNYQRHKSENKLGLTDEAYVEAMKEVCNARNITCFDDYHSMEANPLNSKWMEEGHFFGDKYNGHFSPVGYKYLVSVYAQFLNSILNTSK